MANVALSEAPNGYFRLRGHATPDVLRRAREGDGTAQEILLNRYRDRICTLCWQVLQDREWAEDCAQEIFVKALCHLPEFRAESDFGTWLYRLTLNHCLAARRKENRRQALAPTEPLQNEGELQGARLMSQDPRRQIETRLAVARILARMPEKSRVILLLKEWHQLSYEEMANVLDIPVGTVRSRLFDARQKFIQLWEVDHHGA